VRECDSDPGKTRGQDGGRLLPTASTPWPSITSSPGQASSNLARYDGVKFGFRRAGAHDLLEMYRKPLAGVRRGGQTPHHAGHLRLSAALLRRLLPQSLAGENLDRRGLRKSLRAVRRPHSPPPRPRLSNSGKKVDDPLQMYLSTSIPSPATWPACRGLSPPCGFSQSGPPHRPAVIATISRRKKFCAWPTRYEQNNRPSPSANPTFDRSFLWNTSLSSAWKSRPRCSPKQNLLPCLDRLRGDPNTHTARYARTARVPAGSQRQGGGVHDPGSPGHACAIAPYSLFRPENITLPGPAKGYQISQYELPLFVRRGMSR